MFNPEFMLIQSGAALAAPPTQIICDGGVLVLLNG